MPDGKKITELDELDPVADTDWVPVVDVSDTTDGPDGTTKKAPRSEFKGDPGDDGRSFIWRGPWVTATAYAVDDIVSSGGSSYVCLEVHTAGTFATDLAASKWQLIAQKGDTGVPGTPGADGDDGREVELQKTATHIQWRYVGEATWNNLVALTDIKGEPGDPGADGDDGTDGRSLIWRGQWVTSTAYAVDDIVENGGSTYICLQAHTSGTFATDLSAGKWQLMAQKGTDGSGSGDVVGPASATDNAIARFDGATGKLLQNSATKIDDTGKVTIPNDVAMEFLDGAGGANAFKSGSDGTFLFDVAANKNIKLKGTTGGGTKMGYTDSSFNYIWDVDSAGNVTQDGDLNAGGDITGNNLSGTNTGDEPSATEAVQGVVELATAAETTTGTDTGRAVTPDGLAGSDYGKRVVGILVIDPSSDVATGDGKAFFRIPSVLNGYNLVGVAMNVYTAGTTGTMDVQIRNVTDSVDMLSTKLTIDSTETDTSTAATAAVINTATDDVATGDKIAIDVDAVQTTKAKGLYVELIFQKP